MKLKTKELTTCALFAALDVYKRQILRCVAKEKNTSVLFSSHITEDIEKIADRVISVSYTHLI